MEPYKSEIAKIIEKGFRKSRPKNQLDAISALNKITPPSKEAREMSVPRRMPIEQEMKIKEYKELLKKNNKLLLDKTA